MVEQKKNVLFSVAVKEMMALVGYSLLKQSTNAIFLTKFSFERNHCDYRRSENERWIALECNRCI